MIYILCKRVFEEITDCGCLGCDCAWYIPMQYTTD